MRIYRSDQPEPVNSAARKPDAIVIPPFNFRGQLVESVSDKWYPPYSMRLTGGYVTATGEGFDDVTFTALKNNIFETDGSFYPPTESAIAFLGATDKKAIFSLEPHTGGAIMFTQYDWLTISADTTSGHVGITVQLYGERIN
jgi:hypothetical protein